MAVTNSFAFDEIQIGYTFDGPRVVFVDGMLRPDLSDIADLPAGITIEPISAEEHDVVRRDA